LQPLLHLPISWVRWLSVFH